jgi:integrase
MVVGHHKLASNVKSSTGMTMDKTKLKTQMRKFSEYLIVDKGLSQVTVGGYCRSLSIALRKMRKFVPRHPQIKGHILWMHKKEYSYSHIVNTSIALEHFSRYKRLPALKIGRPMKPKRIIVDVPTEAEVSRMFQAAHTPRIKAILAVLAYSGCRNKELCNLQMSRHRSGSESNNHSRRQEQKRSAHQYFLGMYKFAEQLSGDSAAECQRISFFHRG